MRLLFLLRDYLPPFRADVAVLFGRELRQMGVRTDLLGQAGHSPGKPWSAGSLWLHGRERPGLLGDLLRPLHDCAILWRIRPDHQVLQVRDKIRTALMVRLVARLARKPWVYWMSFPIAEGHAERARDLSRKGPLGWALQLRSRLAMRLFYHHVAPHAHHIFVQSQAMLEHMAARGIPRARMTAVPMGVDTALLRNVEAIRPRPAAWNGRKVIGYLGTLGRSRDPAFLLRTFALVHAKEPSTLLLLVGDAPSEDERAWLRQQIRASGLREHIHLTGWLPQEDALRHLAAVEVAWSAIPRSPLFDLSSPTKAVEYLALGIPCVGNEIPDQHIVLTQSGGGLSVMMNPELFAEATLTLLAKPPSERRAIGERGRRWVAEHRDYAILATEVAKAYRRLVREHFGFFDSSD